METKRRQTCITYVDFYRQFVALLKVHAGVVTHSGTRRLNVVQIKQLVCVLLENQLFAIFIFYRFSNRFKFKFLFLLTLLYRTRFYTPRIHCKQSGCNLRFKERNSNFRRFTSSYRNI